MIVSAGAPDKPDCYGRAYGKSECATCPVATACGPRWCERAWHHCGGFWPGSPDGGPGWEWALRRQEDADAA